MKMYFTKASLKNLSVEILPVIDGNGQRIGEEANPGHKQYTIFDLDRNSPPGFGLYVGKTKSSFFLQVRVGRRVKKVVVGELGALILSSTDPKLDARTRANELRARLKSGENVAQAKREESKVRETTLQDLLTSYIAAYKLKPTVKENTLHAIENAIKRLKPWGELSIRSIGSNVVNEIWSSIAVEQGHRTAAEQTLNWARAAFNHYIQAHESDRNLVRTGRVQLVNPFLFARTFKRSRGDLEQEYLENAVRNPIENTALGLGPMLDLVWERRGRNRKGADYILTTLLLGARKSETGCLVWADRIPKQDWAKHNVVDLSSRTVRFAKTKTNTTHALPLGNFLCWLMQERYRDYPSDIYVFPASSKNPTTKLPFYSSPKEFVGELVKTLSAPDKEAAYERAWATELQRLKKAKVPPSKTAERVFQQVFDQQYVPSAKFTMHDLRRTFATAIATLESVPYAILKKLLNHSMRGDITGLYIDADSPEKLRKYMQLCENELLRYSKLIPKK